MMRKKGILEQLERLLWDMPPEQERKRHWSFEIILTMPEENEATVIQEL